MSSRAFTASAISLASQSQPVRAANSTIESITELRVRASSGTAMASIGSISAMRISSLVFRRGRPLQHGLDLEQLQLVRQADPPLEPMVDVGLGESPLAGHLPARQFAALRQLDHLLGGQGADIGPGR